MTEPATISGLQHALTEGQLTAVEAIEQTLEAVAEWEPHIHAFTETVREEALQQARQQDDTRAAGQPGALSGIPIAIKDAICTREGHTTAASQILKGFRSPYEATCVQRLKAAGAVIIGKTNMDEFAMGSSTEYSSLIPTANPWDVTRVPGGSSGGSAAAVATGVLSAALGTDTGGSVRQPASFCNVVGLKPTYGRVSRFGVIAYGSSLDQVGPVTRTVRDAALILSVIAGPDRYDATSSPNTPDDYTAACGQDIAGMKIGVPREFFAEGIDLDVARVVRQALSDLAERGAVIQEISLPLLSAAVATYYLIAKAEASTNLARYDGIRYAGQLESATTLLEYYVQTRGHGFGPEVKRAILMGTYALSAGYYDEWYNKASQVRTLLRQQFAEAFAKVDVIAGPVCPEVPFKIGSKADDPLKMYLSDAYTVPFSVAGLPALAVPCGFVGELPVGLQLAAPHFAEERLFAVGHAYEQSHDWWKRAPQLPA